MTPLIRLGATRGLSRALLWVFAALLALCVQLPRVAHARDVPALSAHVNDTAGMLSADERARLEQKLVDYERKTSRQFALLTIDSLDGDDLEGFSIRVAEAWKLGQKGQDNGLVLLVVKNDHKLRIEVGYGLEDRVPDVVASRIINERMVPRIRSGDNDGAVRAGVDALLTAIGSTPGKGVPPEPAGERISGVKLVIGIVVLIFLLGFAITHPRLAWLMLLSIGSGRGGGGGGGWGGGGGGGGGFSGGGGRSGGGGASGSW